MVIYVWEDGYWEFEWEEEMLPRPSAKKVDLNKWFEYDLSEQEVLACLEALEE